MAIVALTPATEAAAFTLGCALIHAQRRHAEHLTEFLVVAVVLALLGLAMVSAPEDGLNAMAEAIAVADAGAFPRLQPD